jgi:hypothetical protein
MLQVGSALQGYAIEASDGRIGTVSDFLFDDRTWKVRWLVVDTGTWLTGRKALVHPYRTSRLRAAGALGIADKIAGKGKSRHSPGPAGVTADGTQTA